MASCMSCFRRCCDGNVGGSYVQMREQPNVLLDTSHMGKIIFRFLITEYRIECRYILCLHRL